MEPIDFMGDDGASAFCGLTLSFNLSLDLDNETRLEIRFLSDFSSFSSVSTDFGVASFLRSDHNEDRDFVDLMLSSSSWQSFFFGDSSMVVRFVL